MPAVALDLSLISNNLANDANPVRTAFQALQSGVNGLYGQGLLAARPAAGNLGNTYFATDTKQLFRDNGTGYDEIVVVPLAAQTWQTIALVAGFSLDLSYYKDPLGQVHFRGDPNSVSGSLAGGTVLATLPAGYRPVTTVSFPLADPATPAVANVVQVAASGAISVVGPRTGAHAVSFGAVHYRAEN